MGKNKCLKCLKCAKVPKIVECCLFYSVLKPGPLGQVRDNGFAILNLTLNHNLNLCDGCKTIKIKSKIKSKKMLC